MKLSSIILLLATAVNGLAVADRDGDGHPPPPAVAGNPPPPPNGGPPPRGPDRDDWDDDHRGPDQDRDGDHDRDGDGRGRDDHWDDRLPPHCDPNAPPPPAGAPAPPPCTETNNWRSNATPATGSGAGVIGTNSNGQTNAQQPNSQGQSNAQPGTTMASLDDGPNNNGNRLPNAASGNAVSMAGAAAAVFFGVVAML